MSPDIEIGRYALRTFRVDLRKRECQSISHGGSHWLHGTCEAHCLAFTPAPSPFAPFRQHRAPDEHCNCGIYGTLNLSDLMQFGPVYMRELVAVFAAEGKTIIGDTGLKTEAARIVAYWSPVWVIRKICARQFEGAKYFKDLPAMLAAYEFPREIPFEIRKIRRGSGLRVMSGLFCLLMAGVDGGLGYMYETGHQYGLMVSEFGATLIMLWCARINFRARLVPGRFLQWVLRLGW